MTMLEMIVALAIFSVISLAGFLLFVAGQNVWSTTDARVQMQQGLRRILQRVSMELQESGTDSTGTLQVSVLDGAGPDGSDRLRFAVPLCVCGSDAMDSNGDVKSWGAPMRWGQSGCSDDYPLNGNGKVTICHVPPATPLELEVSPNAVPAHLAHGDWIGDCSSCNPSNYNNKIIEYVIDGGGNLLRQVRDSNNVVLRSDVFAQDITDFQVGMNGAQTAVTLSVQMARKAPPFGTVPLSGSLTVGLKNRN
jgi:prepilin-type N-terminal cleavage/methylation domain-containing protein